MDRKDPTDIPEPEDLPFESDEEQERRYVRKSGEVEFRGEIIKV